MSTFRGAGMVIQFSQELYAEREHLLESYRQNTKKGDLVVLFNDETGEHEVWERNVTTLVYYCGHTEGMLLTRSTWLNNAREELAPGAPK